MLDLKQFSFAIQQIVEEKGIPEKEIIETIELALAAAYKRDYAQRSQNIRVKFDKKTGLIKVFLAKMVVTQDMIREEVDEETEEEVDIEKEERTMETITEEKEVSEKEKGEIKIRFNEERHIFLEEAKKELKDKKAILEPGVEKLEPAVFIYYPLEPKDEYGRIAAQTAKQVIVQRIREAERDSVYNEFAQKRGEIISGIIQRIEGRNVFIDLGRTTGILTEPEQIPGEYYQIGKRLKVYILNVEQSTKGPTIFLSRAYPKMISKLFELEVPEIHTGICQVQSLAREAGSRSKIAVSSSDERVDPVGSCVGQKGTRVTTVINELNGEKIDIIEWSDDPEVLIANALSPAKVTKVKLGKKNHAVVEVPNDQLSLAIGKEGQNVRLAAKLTGWKIDIVSDKGEVQVSAAPVEDATASIEVKNVKKTKISSKITKKSKIKPQKLKIQIKI